MPRSSCLGSSAYPCFVGEGASRRYAFDIGQQQATAGQRNDSLEIAEPETRARQGGQTGRNFSCRRHSERRKPKDRGSDDRQRDHGQCDGLSRPQPFTQNNQSDCDNTDDEDDEARLVKLLEQRPCPVEKIVPATFHTEETWQLGHRNG